eukprot:scaffold3515_cov126-Cylindrotheca_fusiformis.AAC.11
MSTKEGNVQDESREAPPEHHDLKTTIAGIAGNVLEWYDFSVYGYFSDIIGKVFFPPGQSGNAALVESFAVFGIAFLVRPIGGAIFGYMGDNVGRKSALENSILLMALPTFALGCLPSFDSVGWWSTALLILCRALQGFSVGGQLMSSVVFTLEGSDQTKWGIRAAIVFAATTLGAVLGSLVAYAIRESLSDEQLESFGWRIPFFFGLVGAIPGLYLKHRSKEIPIPTSQEETTSQASERPTLERKGTFRETFAPENRRALIASILVPSFTAGGYYIVFVWLAIFMESIIEVPHAFGINSAVGICGLALCFVGGWMADYFGRKARVSLMLLSSLAFGIAAPFFLGIMGKTADPLTCFFLQLVMATLLGIFGGAMQPWLIGNFPPHIRMTSTNITYNLAVSLIGGFSPAAATLMVDHFNNSSPGLIISGLAVLAWIGLWVASTGPKWDDNVELVPTKSLSSII